MLRPDQALGAPMAFAREVDRIALPMNVSHASPQRAFASLYGEIRAEISGFIAEGAGPRHAPQLSVEAQALRARLQGAAHEMQRSADARSADAQGASRMDQQEFVASIAPHAREAAARLGVSARVIAAHAALESGWGRRMLRGPDGEETHNFFGVKTGSDWSGASARAMTSEYRSGIRFRTQEMFRSYGDAASAFRDYTRLLEENPRYRAALGVGDDAQAFAQALVEGRYATDPAYADKLEQVARQLHELDVPLSSASVGRRPQEKLLGGR